jgi:hypothetical protein
MISGWLARFGWFLAAFALVRGAPLALVAVALVLMFPHLVALDFFAVEVDEDEETAASAPPAVCVPRH